MTFSSTKNSMGDSSVHTKFHNKNEDGRSLEIESYIKQSVEWIKSNLGYKINNLLDIGTDYGYLPHYAKEIGLVYDAVGVDPYSTSNPFGVVRNITAEDHLKDSSHIRYDLVTLNHVIEHISDAWEMLKVVKQLTRNDGYIYIGVPHCDYEWATWKGHLTLWNEKFLKYFAESNGLEVINIELRCFRKDCVEIWGLFKNKEN